MKNNESVSWNSFISGGVEIKCKSIEDAKLLLDVCKENEVETGDIRAVDYHEEPYWYINDSELCITKYCCENDGIYQCWNVETYIQNHKIKKK